MSGASTLTTLCQVGQFDKFPQGILYQFMDVCRTQGFRCLDCEKLFPVPQALPQPSPVPGVRRNTATLLTKERILRERKEAFKKTRATAKRSLEEGIRIRGRWISTRKLLDS